MIERDVLKDLRAWRDEFARSHGYDLASIAAALRELDRTAADRLVGGTPRRPEQSRAEPPTKPAHPAAA